MRGVAITMWIFLRNAWIDCAPLFVAILIFSSFPIMAGVCTFVSRSFDIWEMHLEYRLEVLKKGVCHAALDKNRFDETKTCH